MSTETGGDGEDATTGTDTAWSDGDEEAARAVERRCGISLVPGGKDD